MTSYPLSSIAHSWVVIQIVPWTTTRDVVLSHSHTMAGFYVYMPSPAESGGLTAKEIVYAHMPCHFGLPDRGNSKFFCERRLR